ncbi:MAG: nucleotide exchange factor GrpE [Candidatus Hermodarchaeota archaeon]
MTKKQEKEKDLDKENSLNVDKTNSKVSKQKNSSEKQKEQTKSEIKEKTKSEKVELIEEKEDAGLQLEYFSKEELIEQLKELEETIKKDEEKIKELSSWKDKYMRLQAEFENTQKRWEKNRQYLQSQYTASVLKNFLPLYDSFKKALDDDSGKNEVLKQFYNQFLNILKYEGAEPMETKLNDSFDYSFHEALTTVEKEDVEPNIIIDIIQEGWKFKKDVLRYAKVVISKKPKPPEPEPEPEVAKETEEEIKSQEGVQINNKDEDSQTEKKEDSVSDENEYIS